MEQSSLDSSLELNEIGHIAESEIYRYIREIETNESQYLGGLLREIYEKSLQDIFKLHLETRVDEYDKTIESICHHHYSKLSSAVLELRQICKLVAKLKGQVLDINSKIQASGVCVIEANESFSAVQRKRKNLNLTIEKIEQCLPLLQNYIRLKEHYSHGQYYRALKLIQEVEYTDLENVSPKLSFSKVIRERIPKWKENVSDQAQKLERKWLEQSRKDAAEVGKELMRKNRKQFYLDQTLNESVDSDTSLDEAAEALDADGLVNLRDIFKCCHIATLNNEVPQFKEQFINDRHNQLKQLVTTPTFNINSCQHYVATLIGFLHIEAQLQASSPHLSKSVQDIWLKFEQRVCATFKSYQSQINSEHEFNEIKFLLSGLYYALINLNLETNSIVQIQKDLQKQYLEVLLKTYAELFNSIIDKDDFTPLVVSSQEQEFEILQAFPLNADMVDANLNELETPPGENFPKKLPFSGMVLRIFKRIKGFIDEFLMYMNGLEMSQIEKEESCRRAMTSLIRRPLRDALKKKTEAGNMALNILMQLTINIGCLETACSDLCFYISKKTEVKSSDAHINIGSESFKDIRSEIEENIRVRIGYKVQENIELGLEMFDFNMDDDPTGPSDHIRSTLAFLDNNIRMLKKLSQKFQATTLFSICHKLNDLLIQWLLDEELQQISYNSLRQIMIDVNYLENYATDNNKESAEAFIQIHQLLDLVIKNDWNGYISSYSKPTSLYLRVKPTDARIVFEKLNFEGTNDSMMGRLTRNKLKDEISKKLRNLENGR